MTDSRTLGQSVISELEQTITMIRQAIGEEQKGTAPQEPQTGESEVGGETAGDAYARGTTYPAAATVNLLPATVAPGATTAHVVVELDRETPNTVVAHVRCMNGTGGRVARDFTQPVIFRPGDPLRKTVSFGVKHMTGENNVKVTQPSVPDGAKRGVTNAHVRVSATEPPTQPLTDGFREPLVFAPIGKLGYEADHKSIKFDDAGGKATWITRLAHGRTQAANGETGYYGEVSKGVFQRTAEGLLLKSFRLPKPVKIGSPATELPFASSMLAGFTAPELQFKFGSIEWEARMPNRRYAWPALWLLPKSGWPPEIDVYEGFGYNSGWMFKSNLSTNLHFGENNVRTLTRPCATTTMADFGLPNTLDSAFHRFACSVTPEWITIFVDGVETIRYANPFAGQTWYPLMNVAVKAPTDNAYDAGVGDMTVRSVRIWRDR